MNLPGKPAELLAALAVLERISHLVGREIQRVALSATVGNPAELLAGPLAMPLAALSAVLLDRLLGEARRFHPLVGFGNLAAAIEKHLNRRSIAGGVLAWLLAVGPWVALAFWLRPLAPFAVDVVLLYFALGAQSLCEHAEAIATPLREGRLDEARQRVGWTRCGATVPNVSTCSAASPHASTTC